MTLESYLEFCLSLPNSQEGFPFDKNTLVLKVGGKMFALFDAELFDFINLKCDPQEAVELREQYMGISEGYHMNKKHWITVQLHGDVEDALILELTKKSYHLVFQTLSKKVRDEFALR